MLNKNNKLPLISFLLRAGLSIVLLYSAISALLNPLAWIGFVPSFIDNILGANNFLFIHSTFNIILGFWLLSNKKVFYASIITALFMFSIILFNFGALDIIFRDIAIIFMALALAVLSYREK